MRRALLLAAALVAAPLAAQTDDVRPDWNRHVEPFRIFGPLHYVGTNELTVFAFATPEGILLMDGALPESAPLVVASLAKLGLRIEDVKVIVTSHAHFDHVGGVAELKRLSGARLVAPAVEADLIERGGSGDFAFGDELAFPPVAVDRRLADGDEVTLGGITLTARVTGGHTKGSTTWTTELEQDGVRRRVLFAPSLSVPSPEKYRLAGNPLYPEIVDDYRRTFALLETLPVELFLSTHTGLFGFAEKAERLRADPDGENPFVDPEGYARYVERFRERFERQLAEALAAASPPEDAL